MPRLDVGVRVVVLQYSEYRSRFVDEVGTVESVYRQSDGNYYGVKLDNLNNNASSKGLYWFRAKSLKIEDKEREDIPMFKNFNVAEVEFIDNPKSGRYAYALYDGTVVQGDTVVVSTGHHGFALAKVVAINREEEAKKEVQHNREVVCRVDFSQFNYRKEAVKKAYELKRSMEQRIREAQELALYEALAEKDPTLKGMLDEYRILMDSCK